MFTAAQTAELAKETALRLGYVIIALGPGVPPTPQLWGGTLQQVQFLYEFQIIDGKLMPALSTIDGMGDKAADGLVDAALDGQFLSKDDLRDRAKISKTVIETMADLGILGDMAESNQISLFDFM